MSTELDNPFGPGSEPSTPRSLIRSLGLYSEGILEEVAGGLSLSPSPNLGLSSWMRHLGRRRQVPVALDINATGPHSPSSPTNTDVFSTTPSTAVPSEVRGTSKHNSPAWAAAKMVRGASVTAMLTVPGCFPGDDDNDVMNPV
jgi:hypothetical protein